MRDPFCIEGPAIISFSGGRTSAYMLRRILDAGLQPDVHAVFADTGKERAETYAFVKECESRWDVPIHWVYRDGYFDECLRKHHALPNARMRFCTCELKIKPIEAFAQSLGWEHRTTVIGIRADEPRRWAKIKSRPFSAREDVVLPLVDAGVTEADVLSFWRAQPFDLGLEPWESNCDLCFLKGRDIRIRIMRDHPELATWWINAEERTGRTFQPAPRPTYAQLFQLSQLPQLPFEPCDLDTIADCFCGD